ncbi:hypothetical protein MMA231_00968 [Asticcacaulis sp. MM231]|uniref:hypothetical protein n=1 Tax=Asticcacaulis sp. MM231 TaxID=3157666 RepID=UPI0032D5878B
MTAMTSPRKIERRGGPVNNYGELVKAAAAIKQSALVILLSGYAIAGRTGVDSTEAGNMVCVGVATDGVTGGAADGDVTVPVQSCEFKFFNSTSGDLITRADIGKVCYVVDDQTVAKTSATNTRCIAGRITGVDTDGSVWVRVGPGLAA